MAFIYIHPPNGKLKFYLLQGWLDPPSAETDPGAGPHLITEMCHYIQSHAAGTALTEGFHLWPFQQKGSLALKIVRWKCCWTHVAGFLFFQDLKVEHMVTTWISQVVLLIESVFQVDPHQKIRSSQSASSCRFSQKPVPNSFAKAGDPKETGHTRKSWGAWSVRVSWIELYYCQFLQGFRYFGWVSLTQKPQGYTNRELSEIERSWNMDFLLGRLPGREWKTFEGVSLIIESCNWKIVRIFSPTRG